MHDLIAACRALCPVPEGIAKGYWSTFAIWWRNIQIEIFEDRYEYYRFKQGSSDIEYFAHTPGTAMPEELMKRLPA